MWKIDFEDKVLVIFEGGGGGGGYSIGVRGGT